jgi:chemotaxis signal transduction protein
MTAEAQNPVHNHTRLALRLRLDDGLHSIPLHRVHQLVGYATLTGEPEDYFLGWLILHGNPVPVFDLNRVVCDQPTPENFGSRIVVLEAAPNSPTRYLGLLAAGVTDTVAPGTLLEPAEHQPEPLNLDLYLPMLYTLVPPLPAIA